MITCTRCGQKFRDLAEDVVGTTLGDRCLERLACEFRAFGRILKDFRTEIVVRSDRPGLIGMRLCGRVYDRYTENAR